jgi:AcrR family transcriptional regulator
MTGMSTGLRAGRPRDSAIDRAVLDSASELLDELGYPGLAIEQVARRAGVSKTAIYRRWPTRQQLVLAELKRRMGRVVPPQTGCTRCDLVESLGLFARVVTCMGAETVSSLLADCTDDPELRQIFMSTVFDPPRAAVGVTLQQARDRGDLREEVDLTLAVDTLASLVHYRLLFRHAPVTEQEIDAAVTVLLAGIAKDGVGAARAADAPTHSHP